MLGLKVEITHHRASYGANNPCLTSYCWCSIAKQCRWNLCCSRHRAACSRNCLQLASHPDSDDSHPPWKICSGSKKSPKNCYLVTWESGQGALGAWLQTRIVELEDAAAFFGPCRLGGIIDTNHNLWDLWEWLQTKVEELEEAGEVFSKLERLRRLFDPCSQMTVQWIEITNEHLIPATTKMLLPDTREHSDALRLLLPLRPHPHLTCCKVPSYYYSHWSSLDMLQSICCD